MQNAALIRLFAYFSAGSSLVLGYAVVIAWYLHYLTLIQISPSYSPMQHR